MSSEADESSNEHVRAVATRQLLQDRLDEVQARHPRQVRAVIDAGVDVGDAAFAARVMEHLRREHDVIARARESELCFAVDDLEHPDDVEGLGAALQQSLTVLGQADAAAARAVELVQARGLDEACVGVLGADALGAELACLLAARVPHVLLVDAPLWQAELDEAAARARDTSDTALVVGATDPGELASCDVVVAATRARLKRVAGRLRRDVALIIIAELS